MKEALLISECLLGVACRYDGKSRPLDRPALDALREKYELVPVCPEILGGLPTPRLPAERRDGGVFNAAGEDVTAQFARGAVEARRLAALFGCRKALLKERSPSCGCREIYDGSFSGTLRAGAGVAAEALTADGISVFGESDLKALL